MSRKIITKQTRQLVFEKTNHCCFYCGRQLAKLGRDATIDHLKHVYRGGTDDIDNLVAACRSCNSARGGMTPEEFAVYLKEKRRKHMARLGRYGGFGTYLKYGSSHFSELAKLSWKKRRAAKLKNN